MSHLTMTDQDIIQAIRQDKTVGRGTCSVFDEAYTDNELVEYFRECECESIKAVLRLAHRVEGVHAERRSDP